VCVAPTGAGSYFPIYPGLTPWAKLPSLAAAPAGAGSSLHYPNRGRENLIAFGFLSASSTEKQVTEERGTYYR
jgi:hypothetical protein